MNYYLAVLSTIHCENGRRKAKSLYSPERVRWTTCFTTSQDDVTDKDTAAVPKILQLRNSTIFESEIPELPRIVIKTIAF